jgi:hypothetical protein
MEEKVQEQVQQYVYANYKYLNGKDLIIQEFDSHFAIKTHKDSSPLILGKGII